MPGLGGRRWGRATRFDVFNNTTGALLARNLTAAEVVASHLTSLTEEQVIAGVAGYSYVVSNSKRAAAHMSITGDGTDIA